MYTSAASARRRRRLEHDNAATAHRCVRAGDLPARRDGDRREPAHGIVVVCSSANPGWNQRALVPHCGRCAIKRAHYHVAGGWRGGGRERHRPGSCRPLARACATTRAAWRRPLRRIAATVIARSNAPSTRSTRPTRRRLSAASAGKSYTRAPAWLKNRTQDRTARVVVAVVLLARVRRSLRRPNASDDDARRRRPQHGRRSQRRDDADREIRKLRQRSYRSSPPGMSVVTAGATATFTATGTTTARPAAGRGSPRRISAKKFRCMPCARTESIALPQRQCHLSLEERHRASTDQHEADLGAEGTSGPPSTISLGRSPARRAPARQVDVHEIEADHEHVIDRTAAMSCSAAAGDYQEHAHAWWFSVRSTSHRHADADAEVEQMEQRQAAGLLLRDYTIVVSDSFAVKTEISGQKGGGYTEPSAFERAFGFRQQVLDARAELQRSPSAFPALKREHFVGSRRQHFHRRSAVQRMPAVLGVLAREIGLCGIRAARDGGSNSRT